MIKMRLALLLTTVAFFLSAGSAPTFQAQVDNLAFGNPELRFQAWKKLSEGDHQKVIVQLVNRLKKERQGRTGQEPITQRNFQLIEAMERFGQEGLPAMMNLLKKDYRPTSQDFPYLVNYLTKVGPSTLKEIFVLLEAHREELVELGVTALAEFIPAELSTVEKEYAKANETRKRCLVRAIGRSKLEEDKKIPILMGYLAAKDKIVQQEAREQLVKETREFPTAAALI